MKHDNTALATKKDIHLLMEQMGKYYQQTEQRFAEMGERITKEGEETRRHFDVVAENIKHDFQGAFHDKLEQHEDRIVRLEAHAGIAA